MNQLGLNLLVDKSIRRKIIVLNELEKQSRSTKELTEYCDASERTVLVTIDELIEKLPETITLQKLGKNHFSLIINDYFELKDYIKSLMKESPLFIIVETIFEGEMLSVEEMSRKLYVSESSVRKYLLRLEEVLHDYDLTLSYSPIDIEGCEVNIRYFFFYYFSYGHETSSLLKENQQNANALYALLNSLAIDYEVVLNVDYHRLLIWLFIFEKRNTWVCKEFCVSSFSVKCNR